jgi:hypothetical protein
MVAVGWVYFDHSREQEVLRKVLVPTSMMFNLWFLS